MRRTEGETFGCRRCGQCCRMAGYVHLTQADITGLADSLGIDERGFIERYTRLTRSRSGLSLEEKTSGECVFLRDGMCSVYESRPNQCRHFPHLWYVEGGCPVVEAKNKRREEEK